MKNLKKINYTGGFYYKVVGEPDIFELEKVQLKINVYNQLNPQRQEWVIKYWKALKEIWQSPITATTNDFDILKKYGLGDYHMNYKNFYPVPVFDWDYSLKQLDQQLKFKL